MKPTKDELMMNDFDYELDWIDKEYCKDKQVSKISNHAICFFLSTKNANKFAYGLDGTDVYNVCFLRGNLEHCRRDHDKIYFHHDKVMPANSLSLFYDKIKNVAGAEIIKEAIKKNECPFSDDYGKKNWLSKKGKTIVKFYQKYPSQKDVLSYKIYKLRRYGIRLSEEV